MTLIGLIDEPPGFSSTKVAAHVRAMKLLKGGEELQVNGRVRLTIYDPEAALSYGDIIRFTGRLKAIRGFKNPGLFDYSRYVAREGIRASVSIGKSENISKIGIGGNPVLTRVYGWREEVRRSIRRGLSGPSSAILQAMVIGAIGDLTPEIRDQFAAAGVTHILSISGSHLGFVTLLTFFMIRYLLIHLPYRMLFRISLHMIPSKIAALGTFPPVIFYTLISGGEIATVRSLIMALVCLTAILIEREGDPANTLVVAALLVLLWDPQALFDISFQLSYMAVLSMIIVADRFHKEVDYEDEPLMSQGLTKGYENPACHPEPKAKGLMHRVNQILRCAQNDSKVAGVFSDEQGWARRYWRKFKLLMLLTIGATVSTGPIVACYYNQITWAGLLSNMVVVPYVGLAVLPVGLLTSLFALVSHVDVIPLAWFNDLLLRLFYKMVRLFAGLPSAMIYTPSPGIPLILSVYLCLLSLLFFRKRWAKILLGASILMITLSLGCSALARDGEGVMRVTFLDVGQGDSALIEFPNGEVMIIDGGGTFSETFDMGRSVLAPHLWNQGIRRIDYVVSTHPQLDHIEGLAFIAEVFDIGEVWTNGTKGNAARGFYDAVQGRGIREVMVHRGMEDRMIGGCRIGFLNPPVPPFLG
ncbi:MAG: ComEC/Rec2 family competence protein, partial [Nitrospirae bacterium]|nr:ComEC/Rec2 family competence protein [Nitrospirota bacterium]